MKETVFSYSGDIQPLLVSLAQFALGVVIGLAMCRAAINMWRKWEERRSARMMSAAAQPLPAVVCTSCGHVANCARMKDGTVYKPIAWSYPDRLAPMRGICGACRGNRYDGSM